MNTFEYINDDATLDVEIGGKIKKLSKPEFVKLMNSNNLSISSAGVLYENEKSKKGLLASILDTWYADRKEFQRKKQEAVESNDSDKEYFYDKRQLVQKILLNSLYGVLGLESFRFYDIDNALSVTSTGQDIIKSSAVKINKFYKSKLLDNGYIGNQTDFVVYIDTDSNYMSNKPMVELLGLSEDDALKNTIDVACETVDVVNDFYDSLMLKAFNCVSHVIKTAGETIGRSGIWVAKKRYCIHKIYDLEKQKNVDKFHIKGLDVIRSSFPKQFKDFMLSSDGKSGLISDFLLFKTKDEIDKKILEFKRKVSANEFEVIDIAKNSSIKDLDKFEKPCKQHKCVMGQFPKIKKPNGDTMTYTQHAKSAINFNSFIKHHNLDKKVETIFNGEKIKYVYLKKNPLALGEIAFRGYQDPPELMDFINTYIDGKTLYEKEMQKKVYDFYDALEWEYPSEGAKIVDEFFSF